MAFKTGRNDPCTCGSGKKYKNCCLDKESAAGEFKKILSNKDDILKYTEFAESWNSADGPVPTFMEYLGKANPASGIINELTADINSLQFESIQQVQEYMNRKMNMVNSSPVKEFLGFTPRQIHTMTMNTFAENREFVQIKENLRPEMVQDLPVLKQSVYILNLFSENEKGIKITAKGNLPRASARKFYDLFIREGEKNKFIPSGEDDVFILSKLKFFLIDAGLIKKQHGWLSLTKKGRTMLDNYKPFELYKLLFYYFSDKFSWIYGTYYPEHFTYIQRSLVFCLYILKKQAGDFIDGKSLADTYSAAFPSIIDQMQAGYRSSIFISCFCFIFIERYAVSLGLLEEGRGDSLYDQDKNFYKTTPLFNELFEWKI